MEFRLLGSLEVISDGRPVPLQGNKQRAALGLFLLHADQSITISHLVQRLWGEEPPLTARSSVRNVASALRRVLAMEDPTNGWLDYDDFGYRLRVPADTVDLRVARRLSREGRALMCRGCAQDAAPLFRQALRCWRGPALIDVVPRRSDWPELAELHEEYLALVEDRIDADLALGRLPLIDELKDLVRAEPLRERRYGQLMRALHAAGHTAEALAVYRQACAVLADEWGIDPGPELRCLYTVLSAPGPVSAGPRRPTPARWPAAAVRTVPEVTAAEMTAVMFRVDITAQTGDPEEQTRSLDPCRFRIARRVELFGGRTVPVLGSSVLALFDGERHAERAVRAAIATTKDFVDAADAGTDADLALHAAAATGEVRTVRSGDRLDGRILTGRVLDTCRRMSELAPAGQVFVADSTRRAAGRLGWMQRRLSHPPHSATTGEAVAIGCGALPGRASRGAGEAGGA